MLSSSFPPIMPSNTLKHPGDIKNTGPYYRLVVPDPGIERTPLVISCPHAGILIPKKALKTLAVSPQELRARGDRFTDWLTINAPNMGATQIISAIAPSITNVGRCWTSLDENDIRGGKGDLSTRIDKYTRDGKGQGLVAFKTLYGGKPIYKSGQEPNADEIKYRISKHYNQFHEMLRFFNDAANKDHGYALIFDIHSMPSIGTHADIDAGKKRPDLVFSNNPTSDGVSVDDILLNDLCELAEQFGYTFAINNPYQGGYITQLYGANGDLASTSNTEAFQVEFNRESIGIDENTQKLIDAAKFTSMQAFTNAMLAHVTQYAQAKAEIA